jgi:hypothetical protein
LDHFFMFQVFGVLQKWQVCAATALQMSKQSFLRYEQAICGLTLSNFKVAGAEEKVHKPLSNSTIQSLHNTLSAVHSKVVGTDESHIKICSIIWGMCMMKNPPSIWLTINPLDMQDLIAQVLCGQEIDLDHFIRSNDRPSVSVIASDPYASASFFHLIVNTILQQLLGIRGYKHRQSVQQEKGVLGLVELMLVWLKLKVGAHCTYIQYCDCAVPLPWIR